MNFMIGADPEVFVGDALQVRSIVGKIGGTKRHPMPLPIGPGFMVQEDNVAMEFNIPASPTKDSFVANISLATRFLESMIQDQYNYRLVKDSAISFPEEELQTDEARMFGCDPDYNAWTKARNPRPKADDPNLRSCGGHVHIGADLSEDNKWRTGRACDLFLGLGGVLMDTKGDRRKLLYGKPGAIRIKDYGLEYRVLSNFWIFDEKLTAWVYDNTKAALDAVHNGLAFEQDGTLIQQAINDNNKDLAYDLVRKYNVNIL